MARKTFRTIYWNDELESQVVILAEKEDSSVSRLVRRAVEQFLKKEAVRLDGKPINDSERLSFDL